MSKMTAFLMLMGLTDEDQLDNIRCYITREFGIDTDIYGEYYYDEEVTNNGSTEIHQA